MQFKVPQNINLEDKIVGPLTLIQFIYLLVGGMIIYILFQTVARFSLTVFIILAIPIGAVSLGLAFLKIQEQPLSHFIKAGLWYLSHPKTRVWQREGMSKQVIYEGPKKKKHELPPIKRQVEKSQLEKLAYVLDTQGNQSKAQGEVTKSYEKIFKKNKINQNR